MLLKEFFILLKVSRSDTTWLSQFVWFCTVFANQRITVCASQKIIICANQRITVCSNQMITTVCANQMITICANQRIIVCAIQMITTGNQRITVSANQMITICANQRITVCANQMITAGNQGEDIHSYGAVAGTHGKEPPPILHQEKRRHFESKFNSNAYKESAYILSYLTLCCTNSVFPRFLEHSSKQAP